jgi:hypothetical protein
VAEKPANQIQQFQDEYGIREMPYDKDDTALFCGGYSFTQNCPKFYKLRIKTISTNE